MNKTNNQITFKEQIVNY